MDFRDKFEEVEEKKRNDELRFPGDEASGRKNCFLTVHKKLGRRLINENFDLSL